MLQRALLLFLLLPGAALAVDGVREINQACATQGCFPGDSPGFPVQINEPGSYRLTSDLDVRTSSAPENRSGIDIGAVAGSPALDVTIDLNGFTILGPVTCSGTPVTSCSPGGGSGDGIRTNSNPESHTRIKDGFIRGMGSSGVDCSRNCVVSNVVAEQNGASGFSNGNGEGVFRRCVARRNGTNGFFVKGLVDGSVAVANGGYGIFTNPDSRIMNSTALLNGGNGIRCFTCSLLDSMANDNTGVGVEFGGRPVFGRNLIDGNSGGEISGSAFAVDDNRCGFGSC
ncbi:MAG: right-handed parallel beta-helix repeat-containing protein [Wenzhouxiangellaceae bacterium]